MLVYGKCECFVRQMLYVCVLCAAYGSCQCCSLLMLVEDTRRPYGKGLLQSWSHNCLVASHECLLLFSPSCYSECFYDLYVFVCVYRYGVDVCAVCEFWV